MGRFNQGGTEVHTTAIRSSFVTVVAWIFIVLSGFGTLISVAQNIMIHTLFDTSEMERALQAPAPGVPPVAMFMASHMTLWFGAFLLVSALMLAASIGLLLRRNWARLTFVALMVLAIAWNLGGLVLQFAMFSSMQDTFAQAPGAPDMKPFFIAMAFVSVLFALTFSGVFGWIAKRLLSPSVAAEFKPMRGAG
jgi:hypothetical protein